ncbi:MAG: 16S rRNA (adenine(1518)-N(6)/adenine(1519)-N(6))-dimethyltransferase RsmA [Rickettsiales bacterium]|jgi:16S rRNA (adenine1518-N6/adenine1519-N6)-dimethyltransferase|nr:16S rRNA (adenine(1518)-N(6)/adenine(1519)-N(6))-dimethyltransferase RsmA [Rickettsiales bacterium]
MSRAAEIVKKYAIAGKKELGQNFLLDDDLLEKIAASAGDLSGAEVLEVGPGPGGLTLALLERSPQRLVSVEFDRRLVEILGAEIGQFYSNLELIRGDALEIDENKLFRGKFKIVANLPYHIGTALLLKWLENSSQRIDDMTLLLQREVVARMTALPGTRDYGRLSIICQYLCDLEKCFDIPPEAFSPPPKVTSSLVRLRVKENSDPSLLPKLTRLVTGLFAQKRKTLLNNLRTLVPSPREFLERCGLDPGSRAEELPLETILRILQQLEGW